jgi:hypothetical protein
MRPLPDVSTLGHIRGNRDLRPVGEALDQIRSAFGQLPSFADHETPHGPVNGVNTIFQLKQAPNPPASLHLYNSAGNLFRPGSGYTINGKTVTMKVAPVGAMTASYRF